MPQTHLRPLACLHSQPLMSLPTSLPPSRDGQNITPTWHTKRRASAPLGIARSSSSRRSGLTGHSAEGDPETIATTTRQPKTGTARCASASVTSRSRPPVRGPPEAYATPKASAPSRAVPPGKHRLTDVALLGHRCMCAHRPSPARDLSAAT